MQPIKAIKAVVALKRFARSVLGFNFLIANPLGKIHLILIGRHSLKNFDWQPLKCADSYQSIIIEFVDETLTEIFHVTPPSIDRRGVGDADFTRY